MAKAAGKRPIRRRRVIMARLIHRHEDDGSFDREFWRRVGPEGRWAAMWQMVKDYIVLRGGDESDLRFQRTVAKLKRRESAVSRRRGVRRRVSH